MGTRKAGFKKKRKDKSSFFADINRGMAERPNKGRHQIVEKLWKMNNSNKFSIAGENGNTPDIQQPVICDVLL